MHRHGGTATMRIADTGVMPHGSHFRFCGPTSVTVASIGVPCPGSASGEVLMGEVGRTKPRLLRRPDRNGGFRFARRNKRAHLLLLPDRFRKATPLSSSSETDPEAESLNQSFGSHRDCRCDGQGDALKLT
jgi:hypothetical protein